MWVWLRHCSKVVVGALLVCLSFACQIERPLLSDEAGGAVCNPFEQTQFVDLAGTYGEGSPKLFAGCLVIGKGATAKRQLAYLFEGGTLRASGGSPTPPGGSPDPGGAPGKSTPNTPRTLRFGTEGLTGPVPMVFYAFPKQVTTGPNPQAEEFCNSLDVTEPLSCLEGDSPSCLFALAMKPTQESAEGLSFSFAFPNHSDNLAVQEGSACQLLYPTPKLTSFSVQPTEVPACTCQDGQIFSYKKESDWPLAHQIFRAAVSQDQIYLVLIDGATPRKLHIYTRSVSGEPFQYSGQSVSLMSSGGVLRFAPSAELFAVFYPEGGAVELFRLKAPKENTINIEKVSTIKSPEGFVGLLSDVAFMSLGRIAVAWYSGIDTDAVWIYDANEPTKRFKVDVNAPQALTANRTGSLLFVGGREESTKVSEARAALTVLRFVPAKLGALRERKTFLLPYKGTNVRHIAVSHDNRLLAASTGQNMFQDYLRPEPGLYGHVMLWPMNPFTIEGIPVQRAQGKKAFAQMVNGLAFRQDNRLLAVVGSDASTRDTNIRMWSVDAASSTPTPSYLTESELIVPRDSDIVLIESCQRLLSFGLAVKSIGVWRSCQ